MDEKQLTEEEIAALIKAKEVLSKLGKGSAINVKEICTQVGISRKTAYQYHHKEEAKNAKEKTELQQAKDMADENSIMKERIKKLELENRILRVVKREMEELKKKGLWED